MPRSLPKETIQEMRSLYSEGIPIKDIAEGLNVSYSVVYSNTRLLERINPETGELFRSIGEYQDYIARQKKVPNTGKRLENNAAYQRNLRLGVGRFIKEPLKDLTEERERRADEISNLIDGILTVQEISATELASRLGVSRSTIYKWRAGIKIPSVVSTSRLYVEAGIPNPADLDRRLEGVV